MTSKEKAIEAFQSIQADLIDYADILENSTYSTQEDVEIVLEQLNKPTLDDAIAVVEKIKENHIKEQESLLEQYKKTGGMFTCGLASHEEIKAINCDVIIAALRGLKEGKR